VPPPHPGGQWIVQQARNLCMDLDQADANVKFRAARPRPPTFHEGFDAVFTAAGLQIVRSGVRVPRMKLDHGAMDRRMPPRASRPDPHLEPAPPPPDPGGLRASPQRPPASYGPIQRRTAQPLPAEITDLEAFRSGDATGPEASFTSTSTLLNQ